MNCREAEPQIYAARDGALDNIQRAALEGHLAKCDACRRVLDDLTAALTVWRNEVSNVTVPDAEHEWHAVRRRIRGGAESGTENTVRPRNLFTWVAVPVGAAAALAVTLFVSFQAPTTTSPVVPTQIAQGKASEAPGGSTGEATTMVFVDDKSGWLFVWASDAAPQQG